MDTAVVARDLRKVFAPLPGLVGLLAARPSKQPVAALHGVSFDLTWGACLGVMGPTGAGKTTLLKILATLVAPTAGTARVCGYDLGAARAIRACVGFAGGDGPGFYARLTGRQNLRFFAALYRRGAKDVERALAAVELDSVAERAVQTYSSGMRQRLALARALLHEPCLLLLDEPTRSLDPAASARVLDLLDGWRRAGQRAILLVTHRPDEAAALCDRVLLLDQGRVRALDTPSSLRERGLWGAGLGRG
ncbi:MAG: ABC transporter ATP-binding protein [Chloroflexi bacterium]|nr:ABC transporter ATP-binding protein [Chloroflexota bacterium]